MSAFEIRVTPKRNQSALGASRSTTVDEQREPTVVQFGPFTPKAVVVFGEVPVGKTARRYLSVLNNAETKILVTKAPKPENRLLLEWTSAIIPSSGSITLQIEWSPCKEGIFRDSIHLQDDAGQRKEVSVQMRAVEVKRAGAKRTAVVPKKLKLKQPSPPRQMFKRTAALKEKRVLASANRNESTVGARKQQQPPLNASNIFANMQLSNLDELFAPAQNGKENFSPHTPVNASDLFGAIKFTPVTETKTSSRMEKFAQMTTPLGTEREEFVRRHGGGGDTPLRHFNLQEELAQCPTPLGPIAFKQQLNITPPFSLNLASGDFAPQDASTTRKCERAAAHDKTNESMPDENDERPKSRLSTETYVKCISPALSDFGGGVDCNEIQIVITSSASCASTPLPPVMNVTRTMDTSQPMLSVIAEEAEGSSPEGLKGKTFNVRAPISPNSSCCSSEESGKTDKHQIRQKQISESLADIPQALSYEHLKANQGSMPNLYNFSQDAAYQLNSIENNRYYHTANESVVSQPDMLFRENEICAQSSRFNLHPASDSSDSVDDVPARKSSSCHELPATLSQHPPKVKYGASFKSSPNLKGSKLTISPPKRTPRRDEGGFLIPSGTAGRVKEWSIKQPKKVRMPVVPMKLVLKTPASAEKQKERVVLFNPDLHLSTFMNPDPFAATTTFDPFLASSMYLDERAIDKHCEQFKRWLNALVTIPAELDAKEEKIDVGRLFNDVRNKEVAPAPCRELVVRNYYRTRFDALRYAAVELFRSAAVSEPCSKVAVQVEKKLITLRDDRHLHLDLVLQRQVLELLLCFNTLWLRIGLEVVFGEQIAMTSNADVHGLSAFIVNRMFRDAYLERKYSKAHILSAAYAEQIKKFTLKKMLMLLLFLDTAKRRRLIKQNPCLFVRSAPLKETKEILFRFASLCVANVGDIAKHLRRFGYVLSHKQTYLDEFNYAFQNLGIDLRDGVRLTKVMEIILMREDLSQQLRVPAISRLQKVHNVDLAVKALAEAGFEIQGDITAKDICDGHREKTLSLLWQIIYKFRAPKFHAAARTIQNWWQKLKLRVIIARRIREREEKRRNKAASIIQRAFRAHLERKRLQALREKYEASCIVLQAHIRRYLAVKRFRQTIKCIETIQRWYRSTMEARRERESFIKTRQTTTMLQRWFRRQILVRKLLAASKVISEVKQEAKLRHEKAIIIQRSIKSYVVRRRLRQTIQGIIEFNREQKRRHLAAARIQSLFRMRRERWQFQMLKSATITLQSQFRAHLAMKMERKRFEQIKWAAVLVQRRRRALIQMRQQRFAFVRIRNAALVIQNRFRANRAMQAQQKEYQIKRLAIITIQRRLRAVLAGRKEREEFLTLRKATTAIQRRFRSNLEAKARRKHFLRIKEAVLKIQRLTRATIEMRRQRERFLQMKEATLSMQKRYRARKVMLVQREEYQVIKRRIIYVQQKFRATLAMREERDQFFRLKQATIVLQSRFRAQKLMKAEREKYVELKTATLTIQQHFRAYSAMKATRNNFLCKKRAAIILQQRFRARLDMKAARSKFLIQKAATISIQRQWRALIAMQEQRTAFLSLRASSLIVQRRFRAQKAMQVARDEFNRQKKAILTIQRYFRATRMMKEAKESYQRLRNAVLIVQSHFRAKKTMQAARQDFQEQKSAAKVIQTHLRAFFTMRHIQVEYQMLRKSTIFVQQRYRAVLAGRIVRHEIQTLKTATQKIQIRFRATQLMRIERRRFLELRHATVTIQQQFRAHLLQRKIREDFLRQRNAVLFVQRRYRANKAAVAQRAHYLRLRDLTISLQARARGVLARRAYLARLTPEVLEHRRRVKAARVIQANWRGFNLRKRRQTRAMREVAHRLAAARERVEPANTVRNRLVEYVQTLRGKYIVGEAIYILKKLANLSRSAPYVLIDHAEFIVNFCYGLMAMTIRSEPDKQVIELCACVILNLARYEPTTEAAFKKNGLRTISQMLLRWCDKECGIFNTFCTLVWIFGHSPAKKNDIRQFLLTPDAKFYLEETKRLVLRKDRMRANAQRVVPHCQLTSGATTRRQQLPSLVPDYGVIKGKPYVFTSSVFAFEQVISIFDITL